MATKIIAGSPNEDTLSGVMSYEVAEKELGGPVCYFHTSDNRIIAALKNPGENERQNRTATALLHPISLAGFDERGVLGDVVIGTSDDFGLLLGEE